MSTFVLVHGAFRGGWAWRGVRAALLARGHDVHAPSLTGMGDRAHLGGPGRPRVTLGTWVDDVVALCETHDLTDVVLVGHSQGGLVTTAAAAALTPRLRHLVHLDAPVPRDGERGVDLNPPGVPGPPDGAVDLDAWLPPRPVEPGADGMSPGLAAWVNARLCATPVAPSFEPVRVTAEVAALPATHVYFAATPRTYPCWSTRLRREEAGEPVTVVPGGHDAPLVDPERVAGLLESALTD